MDREELDYLQMVSFLKKNKTPCPFCEKEIAESFSIRINGQLRRVVSLLNSHNKIRIDCLIGMEDSIELLMSMLSFATTCTWRGKTEYKFKTKNPKYGGKPFMVSTYVLERKDALKE